MIITGTEFCGHCGDEFDFGVEDDVWILPCKTCGRPTVLCDKCHTMELDGDCGSDCKQCIQCRKLEKKWMKDEIGKIYFIDTNLFLNAGEGIKNGWYNASEGIKNGWYKVISFDKTGSYELESLDTGEIITTYGEMIDYDKKYSDVKNIKT